MNTRSNNKNKQLLMKLIFGSMIKDAIDNNIKYEMDNVKNHKKDEESSEEDDEMKDNEEYESDDDEDYEDDDDYEEEEDDDDDDGQDTIFLDEDEIKRSEILSKIEDKVDLPDDVKEKLRSTVEDAHDLSKVQEWVSNVMKIPFNKYISLPVDGSSSQVEIVNFFKKAKGTLDGIIYGMENVKEEIMSYIAQFISNKNTKPRVMALQGDAGVGKTSFIRRGLSPILNRPIKCISMGGINDSSTFHGFDYTYVGSKYGVIARSIIECGVMNPIIYMDELDKISETNAGQDIMNFLIHITDPEQSMMFEDKYFAGIPIDLSKVMFVFSFNDEHKVNPILLDRLNVIRVNAPSTSEKIVIAKEYMLKEICNNVGISTTDVQFSDDAVRKIVMNSDSKGMRDIKRNMETIVLKINTLRLTNGEIKFSFSVNPREVDEERLVKVAGKKRIKMMEIVKKKIYFIDEDKVNKLLFTNNDDSTSYKMMYL